MQFPNFMVDLETLDNVPGGVIISIGAVAFNAHTGELGPQFYAVANTRHGLNCMMSRSKETLAWWDGQSKEARAVLEQSMEPHAPDLADVLESFAVWVRGNFDSKHVCPWSNGADFDLPFLQVAFRVAGLELPWRFYNNRCYRSLKNLLGAVVPKPEFAGTQHNALDDAIHQAKHAIDLLRVLQSMHSLYDTYAMARDQPDANWHNPAHNISMRTGLFPAANNAIPVGGAGWDVAGGADKSVFIPATPELGSDAGLRAQVERVEAWGEAQLTHVSLQEKGDSAETQLLKTGPVYFGLEPQAKTDAEG